MNNNAIKSLTLALGLTLGQTNAFTQTSPAAELSGEWRFEAIWDGKTWQAIDSSAQYLALFDEGEEAISGNVCNRFRGKLGKGKAANSIAIGPLMGTKMACPAMDLENKLLAQLQKANRYAIDGDTLQLLHDQQPLLRLKRYIKPAPQLDEGMNRGGQQP